jgi:hypothetical protein
VEFCAGMASIRVQEVAPRTTQYSCNFERMGHCFVLHNSVSNHQGRWCCTCMQDRGDGHCVHQGGVRRRRAATRMAQAGSAPRHPPLRLADAVVVLHTCARPRGARGWKLRHILGCLSRDYLLSLPLLPGLLVDQSELEARILRYLFQREVASVLRWTERRVEGRNDGYSEALNAVLRSDIYPDEHRGGVQSGSRSSPVG